jgi:hypothetical protein
MLFKVVFKAPIKDFTCLLQSIFKNPDEEEDEVDEEDQRPLEAPPEAAESSTTSSFLLGQNWRDLIPVIKIDLVRFFDNFGVVRKKIITKYVTYICYIHMPNKVIYFLGANNHLNKIKRE